MSNLKNQIAQLKNEFKRIDKSFSIIILDDKSIIKIGPKEMIKALCSIGMGNEHRVVKIMRGHKIDEYTGSGSMPQLIKSIVNSIDLYCDDN